MSNMDRDDDRYANSAFDPVMVDEMDTYDATDEDDEPAGRGWLMLIVVVAVLAALAGVVYFAYQQGREEGIRTAPPIVRAASSMSQQRPRSTRTSAWTGPSTSPYALHARATHAASSHWSSGARRDGVR